MSMSGTEHGEVGSGNLTEDELLRLACDRMSESIFHAKFEVRDSALIEDHVTKMINDLKLEGEEKIEWEQHKDEVKDNTTSEFTTGFVVGEVPGYLLILTCAHSFQARFSAKYPLSITSKRNMFKISVRCDHQEQNHNPRSRNDRQYTKAYVCKMDIKKDMWLLRVSTGCTERHPAVESLECTKRHPALEIADKVPDGLLGPIGMVSWPFDRHRTTVKGSMCHNSRGLMDFNDKNRHGYNFKAVEINITADAGSSGAPAVDTAAMVVGMLHGGNIDCVTYFVSLDDLTTVLTSWGVLKKMGGAGGTSGSKGKGEEVASCGMNLKRKEKA